MIDIVERTRREAEAWDAGSGDVAALLRENADEIERLRADVARLEPVAADAERWAAEANRCDDMVDTIADLRSERDALRADALRYRWLRGCNNLTLRSDNTGWTRPDGTRYRQTHYLAEGRTQHAPADSLDATIDAAMAAQKDAP